MELRSCELPWLVEPPPDFRQQVRHLALCSSEERTSLARKLSKYRLSGNALHRLGTVISALAVDGPEAVRLGVLSNGTLDLLLPALAVSSLRHGVWVQAITAEFGQIAAEALNPTSAINLARCHFVLVSVDHRGLPLTPTPGNLDASIATIDVALRHIDSVREGLHAASECTVILQTVPQIGSTLFGSMERSVAGTLPWLIDRYNSELRVRVSASSDIVLDASLLAEVVGLDQWHDPAQWVLGKFPFAHAIVPLYADWVGRLIAAARGKARKCLVLDLDNTLWGGVIGDDGLPGIELGNGSPNGEAYLGIQQMALALRDRGIVLAVASKNDEDIARNVFRTHPEMLLKEEHIAVFQANWRDKAANLHAIAKTLDIGVDALVFLDDNPAERAQVRQALPEVAVPELPIDPAFYTSTLLAAGYFEAVHFTAEDRLRADQYQLRAARADLREAATDVESYLRSLKMKAIFSPFDRIGRPRIVQLINKTNQFNLTTRRYTEAEVAIFEQRTSGLSLQVRLIDRFGDNGVVAVVICVETASGWLIDTWLMSCRVLNRTLENATLDYVVAAAKRSGIRSLIGDYVMTERNSIVREHYARLGFSLIESGELSCRWTLDVASYRSPPIPMEIVAPVYASSSECMPA